MHETSGCNGDEYEEDVFKKIPVLCGSLQGSQEPFSRLHPKDVCKVKAS
jgi:hypothetical protein